MAYVFKLNDPNGRLPQLQSGGGYYMEGSVLGSPNVLQVPTMANLTDALQENHIKLKAHLTKALKEKNVKIKAIQTQHNLLKKEHKQLKKRMAKIELALAKKK